MSLLASIKNIFKTNKTPTDLTIRAGHCDVTQKNGSVANSILADILMSLNTTKIGIFARLKPDKLLFATEPEILSIEA